MNRSECNHCGTVSYDQPVGDGCHSCLTGTMISGIIFTSRVSVRLTDHLSERIGEDGLATRLTG